MLTVLVALHCTFAGVCFAGMFLADRIGAGMGQAFGFGSRHEPLWKIVLMSAVWEIPLGLELLGIAKDKLNAMRT